MRSLAFEKERAINAILAKIDSTWISSNVLAKPETASIAIGTACDLKCEFCSRQHFIPVDSAFMDFASFRELIANLIGTKRAYLFGLGDPLLNRQFLDFVKVCHSFGIETSATTHAMHLTEQISQALIEEGMEELAISLDAAEQPLLEKLRGNSDLARISTNVRRLAELKKQANSPLPMLIVTCTMSTLNLHEMPSLVELAADLGAEAICFSDMIAIKPEFVQYTIQDREVYSTYLEQARARADALGLKVAQFYQKTQPWRYEVLPNEGMQHGCSMVWNGLFVEREGDTRPCCYLGMAQSNAFNEPLTAVMHSPEKMSVRKEMLEGKIRLECRGCASLIPNSRDRVERILQEVERDMDSLDLLSADDKAMLRSHVVDYRKKCNQMFSQDGTPASPNLIRSLARRTLPAPIRYAFRRIRDRVY